MKINQLITLPELSKETGLHPNTLYNYIKGDILTATKIGSRYVFNKEKAVREIWEYETSKSLSLIKK